MAKATKKAAVKVDEFVITVKIDNDTYEGRGTTALEALRAVPFPTNDLIGMGTVVVTHSDKSRDYVYSSMQLRRLANPYNMEVLVNDLAQGL